MIVSGSKAETSRAQTMYNKYKVRPSLGIDKIYARVDNLKMCNKAVLNSINKCDVEIGAWIEEQKQTNSQVNLRIDVFEELKKAIEPYFSEGHLLMGGSTLNNMSTTDADLDLCFSIRCTDGNYYESIAQYVLSKINAIVERMPFIDSIRYIDARVPILEMYLKFPYHDIKVDINCNCVAGIYNSHLLHHYAKLDYRFVQMSIRLKFWCKKVGIVKPKHGKVNSYTVTLMVLHFLQCGVEPPILPNLFELFPSLFDGSGEADKLKYEIDLRPNLPEIPKNDRTVGELIYGFLDYYSRFDYDNWRISIREGRIQQRKDFGEDEREFLFFLEEAYDGMTVPKNLKQRHKLAEIVETFKEGRRVLLANLFHNSGVAPPEIDTDDDFCCTQECWGKGRGHPPETTGNEPAAVSSAFWK